MHATDGDEPPDSIIISRVVLDGLDEVARLEALLAEVTPALHEIVSDPATDPAQREQAFALLQTGLHPWPELPSAELH